MQYYGIKPASFGQLGVHGKQIKKSDDIGILKIKFLRPYCIAYIDQIILNHKKKKFSIESTYREANQYLKQCGFEFLNLNAKCLGEKYPEEHIIKIKRFYKDEKNLDENVVKWIKKNIIKYIPKVDKTLERGIIKNLWEIVCNGIYHGISKKGITVCGQFYPMMNYFEAAFYDCGIGLTNKIRSSGLLSDKLKDEDYIEWASQKGTTTNPTSKTGGLGLFILKNFVRFNRGALQIISGNGYYANTESEQSQKQTIKNYLEGTLVNIRVNYKNS